MNIYVILAAVIIAFGAGWTTKGWKVDSDLLDEIAEVSKRETELKEKYDELVLEREKVKEVIVEKKIYITKKVPVYVPKESDARCVVNNGAVWMFNNSINTNQVGSASGTLGAPTEGTQAFTDKVEQDSGIKLSEVIETASMNNQTCLGEFDKLSKLQSVVKLYIEKTTKK
jgi:hypothetical protein